MHEEGARTHRSKLSQPANQGQKSAMVPPIHRAPADGSYPAGGAALIASRPKTIMIETEILRAEHERLYKLPDLLAQSRDVLG